MTGIPVTRIPISEGGMALVKDMWSEKRAKRRNDTLNKLAMIKSWRDKAWCGGMSV